MYYKRFESNAPSSWTLCNLFSLMAWIEILSTWRGNILSDFGSTARDALFLGAASPAPHKTLRNIHTQFAHEKDRVQTENCPAYAQPDWSPGCLLVRPDRRPIEIAPYLALLSQSRFDSFRQISFAICFALVCPTVASPRRHGPSVHALGGHPSQRPGPFRLPQSSLVPRLPDIGLRARHRTDPRPRRLLALLAS